MTLPNPVQLCRISPEIPQSSSSHGHPRRTEGSGPCVFPGVQESLSREPAVKSWGSQGKWKVYLAFICSTLCCSNSLFTHKATGRKPWNCSESTVGRKPRTLGSLGLQDMLLSFWGGPAGSSLSPRDVVELDDSMLRCKPKKWWIYDRVIVTALPQTFCDHTNMCDFMQKCQKFLWLGLGVLKCIFKERPLKTKATVWEQASLLVLAP